MAMSPGSVFAGYTILRLLGSGGMGEAYLADHPRLPRKDALKILPSEVSADAEYRERFLREADLAASLWHPNIVRVNDRGDHDGQLWIAMDYVDGSDAGHMLSSRYPAGMPVDLATKIAMSVAEALDYSHRQGLLHRDVKPANIMVTDPDDDHERRVLLADFGIARSAEDISGLTATNMTVGTVAYTAPEQLMGEPLDGRADQYALAATAFQLLTGSQLFPHTNPAVVICRHLNTEPPVASQHRPELAGLDAVLSKALSKAPDDRYVSCKEFARDLASQAPTEVSTAASPTRPAPHQPKVSKQPASTPEPPPSQSNSGDRRRWPIPAVGAVVVLVAVAVTWAVVRPSSTSDTSATPGPTVSSPSSSSIASPGLPVPTASSSSPVTTFAAPAPNPNRPPQGNCPPACTQIPDAAWIEPSAIPLYGDYRWAPLAPLSEPVSNPRFLADEMCGAGPQPIDEREGALAARIILPNPPGQWQLQVQILHWRGDPWIAGQRASAVMDAAVSLLRDNCSFRSPGVSVTRIAEQNLPAGNPGQSLTATITENGTSPRVAHVYLISDLRNSTVIELAMSSTTPPAVVWPTINDDQVLAAMVAPLCTAYVNSCAPEFALARAHPSTAAPSDVGRRCHAGRRGGVDYMTTDVFEHNRGQTPPSNNLGATHPLLAAQWHPTLNDRDLSSVTAGAKLKAFWLCPACSHVWQARVSSRAHGHGCPACARRETGRLKSLPQPGDSLAERFPDVAAEWHPSLNDDLTPEMVGYASNKKVWWLCGGCGHEWQIQVANRTSGSSCRKCAHATLRKPKPGGSLAERNPAVAAEWHRTLNGDLTPNDVAFSAKRKAWWRCARCGNEWEASVGNRAVGAGCPGCGRRGRSARAGTPKKPETEAAHSTEVTAEAPSAGGSDRALPAPNVPPGTALSERFPEIAAQWHPAQNGEMKPAGFRWASNVRAWWLCPTCGHEWSAIIISRTRGGSGCPKCGRRRAGAALGAPKPGQSLAERLPELAAQWHPTRNGELTPAMVTAKSGKRAWWLCPDCGNEWEAQIGSRAVGSGCKACATQQLAATYAKPSPGQSLAEQDEELASQWHPTLNGDLTPADVTGNSGRKAWWLCARGHEWQAMINNRTKARGCPKCILWGTSAEEIRLRHELVAAGVPIEVGHTVISPPKGRPLNCDMVIPVWNAVIEFDGNRFHKTPEGHDKDRRKTAALTAAGWRVIRVREELEPIGSWDVVVPKFSSEVVRAKAVLKMLDQLGHRAARHDEYLLDDGPWATAAAEDEIRRPRPRSLASEVPALAAEWDYAKNAPLTPEHVTFGSGQKAWWLCPVCGNSWQAVIGSRSSGVGCPSCGRKASLEARSRPRSGNSLADRHPKIAAEWHPTRNGDVTPDAGARQQQEGVVAVPDVRQRLAGRYFETHDPRHWLPQPLPPPITTRYVLLSCPARSRAMRCARTNSAAMTPAICLGSQPTLRAT